MTQLTAHRPTSRTATLLTVLAVLFLTFLDTTIVSVSLGGIQYDLGAGVIGLQWVVSAYSLVFASLMLIAGSLSDRYGPRTVLTSGIVVFCGGSLICAVAPGVSWVIAGRAVMGVGAAAAEPITLAVIRRLFPDRGERSRALAAWAAVSGVALAAGPVLGGLLISLGSWRSVFWFNLVLGLVLLVAASRTVGRRPERLSDRADRLDLGGFVFGALAIGGAIFAAISGEQYGYRTWWIIALFVAATASSIAFIVTERHVAKPMLDVHYLRDRAVSSALFIAFALYFGIFAIFFLAALYLDIIVGYSGTRTAGAFAPMAVAIVVGSVASGRRVAAVGTKAPMVLGCAVSATGIMLARSVLTATPSYPWLLAALAVAGLGFGIAVVPVTAAVLGHVPPERAGMAASATNTARQLGSVVGVATLGAIVDGYLTHDFGRTLAARGTSARGAGYLLGLLQTGGSSAKGVDLAHPPALIRTLVDAAADAFRTGMHVALLAAAVLIVVAGAVAALVSSTAFAPGSDVS